MYYILTTVSFSSTTLLIPHPSPPDPLHFPSERRRPLSDINQTLTVQPDA